MLVNALELGEGLKDVPVLLVIPGSWPRPVRLKLLRMLLEGIGVGGVYIAEASLMAAFGCATPTALVVDVGQFVCQLTALVEGEAVPGANEMLLLAGKQVDEHFSARLLHDPITMDSIRGVEPQVMATIEDFARAFRESEHSHPSRNSEGSVQPVRFPLAGDISVAIGDSRMTMMDVLFETRQVGPSLIDALLALLCRCDLDKRAVLLDHIILTGGLTRHPLFKSRFEAALRLRLAASEFAGEFQCRTFRLRSVPEYYPEIWQRATPMAAWFGGGITAKCVLGDPKNYYTRDDLLHHGSRIFKDANK